MTDNEKTRKYANYMIHHSEIPGERNRLKQAYLDGLTEGRKELEELKEKLKGFENCNVAYQGDMDRTIEQNMKLKAQIEKMKNVGNCKKAMTCAKWNEKQTILGCMKFCKNCKKWELSE